MLLRFVERSHPLHTEIRDAIRKLRNNSQQLQVTSQNCVEFWNVATRPISRNGFGLTPDKTEKLLRLIERLFPVLLDSSDVYQEWRRLVVKFGVSGVQVHDARLVAAMKVHKISHILTFNMEDFTRYKSEGILAIAPETVLNENT
ncbi:type II toxin-antitoxin system VapC family toxin [Nostoc sp. TCL26-01]|uniref:type II toxin-antitoxin system VapC family toxin n=1 Tax=Nostoc sp. TCL26-01 TaxID=2576904 RepID=UPI003566D78D